MTLTGYCEVQDCEYTISVDEMPAANFEHQSRILYGLIDCQYASYGNNCTGECSILKQHGIKQG